MTRRTLTPVLACSVLCIAIGACAGSKDAGLGTNPSDTPGGTQPGALATVSAAAVDAVLEAGSSRKLSRFASNDALGERLEAIQKRVQRRYAAQAKKNQSSKGVLTPSSAPGESFDAAPAPQAEPAAEDGAGADESITNTQEAGVDEGGIVKAHGDHLVVLRRGRLFTVEVGDNQLRPTSQIDVSPAKGHDAWYDEMLISGDTIVVVGFSYQVGSTELGLFHIDDRGQLSRKDTFFLRSNDYYSSRNYASRLIGDKLVFYMPHYLGGGWNDESPNLPGVASWNAKRRQADDWNAIIDGSKVFEPVQNTDNPVLHSVITCDLGQGRFSCDAQGILGPPGRNFYVSPSAVYVWTHEGWRDDNSSRRKQVSPAAVYRLPLDGGQVGALRTWGAPVDQFSFKESGDGYLNVLVRADSKGDAMWSPEFADGDIGMMRVPVAAFDRGVSNVRDSAFVDLPEPQSNGYAFQNRFVGDYLLYGMGSGWGGAAEERRGAVFAHAFASAQDGAQQIPIPHGVDRIEAMGSDAVVIGSDGRNLHFSAVELGAQPGVGGAYVQPSASQGELRSHGFFYKPTSPDRGMLGLPIRNASAPGHAHLTEGSAEVLFLDVDRLNFAELGALASDPRAEQDDKCEVSCVDWYGNARPLFYQGRIFALLGYELVEGAREQGSIHEKRRANMLHQSRSVDVEQAPWKR